MTEKSDESGPIIRGSEIRVSGAETAARLAEILTESIAPAGETESERALRMTTIALSGQVAISILQRGNIRALQTAQLIDGETADSIVSSAEQIMHIVIGEIMQRLGYAGIDPKNDSA